MKPFIERVIEASAWHYGIPPEGIRTGAKGKESQARGVAAFIIRRRMMLSLPQLGDLFNVHHTTILHWMKKIEREWNLYCFTIREIETRAIGEEDREEQQ